MLSRFNQMLFSQCLFRFWHCLCSPNVRLSHPQQFSQLLRICCSLAESPCAPVTSIRIETGCFGGDHAPCSDTPYHIMFLVIRQGPLHPCLSKKNGEILHLQAASASICILSLLAGYIPGILGGSVLPILNVLFLVGSMVNLSKPKNWLI